MFALRFIRIYSCRTNTILKVLQEHYSFDFHIYWVKVLYIGIQYRNIRPVKLQSALSEVIYKTKNVGSQNVMKNIRYKKLTIRKLYYPSLISADDNHKLKKIIYETTSFYQDLPNQKKYKDTVSNIVTYATVLLDLTCKNSFSRIYK